MLIAAGPKRSDHSPITIVVADDHALVRHGLQLLIDDEEGLQVVAEARTVPDAERLTRAHQPSVLVLDLSMPGGSSLEAIPRLLASAPETAVVALTMHADPAFAHEALGAGALGFVLTEAAGDDLPDAIRLAAGRIVSRAGARCADRVTPSPRGSSQDVPGGRGRATGPR